MVSICLGVDFEDMQVALENFSGVERRCQFIREINGAKIYHDYAHHPEQIKKMVQVGRELASKTAGKVIVVFEPHTYSRTKFLIDEFVESFKGVSTVIFAPAYSAREKQKEGFDALKLANCTRDVGIETIYLETFQEIKCKVLELATAGDVVFILGAGTIEKLAKMF